MGATQDSGQPPLPPWIQQISPTGESASLAQVRVRFAAPLIPLESIETSDVGATLSYFRVEPSLDGAFRFVTPRMVVFEQGHALPDAMRVTVTLKSGLSDLEGDRLKHDLVWSFTTAPLTLTLPFSADAWDLDERIYLASNAAIDLPSLRSKARLVDAATGKTVLTTIEPAQDQQPSWYGQPQAKFDPSLQSYGYIMRPIENLAKDHQYRLEVDAGLVPRFGNMPSADSYASTFYTYAPLALIGLVRVGQETSTERASMRFAGGTAELVFNNPLAPGTGPKNVSVTSAHGSISSNAWQEDAGGQVLTLDPWKLRPDTNYTVSVGPGITDKYGQKLGRRTTFAFDTDDIAADFELQTGTYTYPATLGLELLAQAISLPDDRYQAAFASMTPAMLANEHSWPEEYWDPWPWRSAGHIPDPLPPLSQWHDFAAPATRNVSTKIDLGLSQELHGRYGVLEYGMSAKIPGTLDDQPGSLVVDTGRVNVTDLGLFAQVMPSEALALVHRLSDGSPVAGARVDFYLPRMEWTSNVTPCASGTTDRDGRLLLAGKAIGACGRWNADAGGPWGSQPDVLVVASAGADWTYARMPSYTTPLGVSWDAGDSRERGAFFSDRGLYQPGEKASFEAYAFYLQDDDVHRDSHRRFSLKLRYPDYTEHPLGSRTTNDFGSFSYDMVLPKGLQVGEYALEADAGNGADLYCYFTVAEFKAPNFNVAVALDKRLAVVGETVAATGTSSYLFGRPVDRGSTHVDVERLSTDYAPPGWPAFAFGRQYWPQPQPTPSTTVLTSDVATDADGVVHQSVPVGDRLPFAMSYRVEMTTTDASNLAVASSSVFTALPAPELVGVRGPELTSTNEPIDADIVDVSPNGSPIAGQSIHVILARFDWDPKTGEYREVDVGSTDVVSARSAVEARLVPKAPGWYRVRAMSPASPADEGDHDVWVYGPGEVDWGSSDPTSVSMQLDKPKYEPGDTATLLVKSPYAKADLYVAVLRQRTFFRTMREVSGAAPTVSFTVTPDMVPNASVEVVLIRRGAPITKTPLAGTLARFGSIELPIALDRRYLNVSVVARHRSDRPGDTQTLDLRLTDSNGDPVRGQFTVMVADEAIIQLDKYALPDLVHMLYAGWSSSASSADNRIDALLDEPTPSPTGVPLAQAPFLQAADVYSVNAASKVIGHVTARAAFQGLRVDFQQLAYFDGELESDDDGKATVAFKTPDNLTTWRVMVVAEAADGDPEPGDPADYRFGGGDTSFVTTLPLTANPLLPQFARPGDVFKGGVATDDNTGVSGALSIDGILGGQLAFFNDGQSSKTTSASETATPGSKSFRFPMLAGPVGDATVRFDVAIGALRDAFLVPFSIKPLDLTETVVDSGATQDSATIPISVDPSVLDGAGGLNVSIASTLLPETITPAESIFDFDYLPFAEPLASRVLAGADMRVLASRYGQTIAAVDPVKAVEDALPDLQRLQAPDGGFLWYPAAEQSDPYLSAYVAQALGRARSADFAVDPTMIARLTTYLTARLDDPDPDHWCFIDACVERLRFEAMQGLVSLGTTDESHVEQVYDQRDNYDLDTQIELARYLTNLPAWSSQATALSTKIDALVYETGRYATLNLPDDLWWCDSVTKGQADALRLFVARRISMETLDRMVRSLLALRRDGDWQNTYDDAQALTALVDYAGLEPQPPDFSAAVSLAGSQLASAEFQGYGHAERDTAVAMSDMPRGRSDLELSKRGTGTLHYVVSYSYRLAGPQPGIGAGLLVTRDVVPAGGGAPVARMAFARPTSAFSLETGKVYDIGVTIVADHPVNQVVIVDPLPAGLEAVDTSFDTTPTSQSAMDSSWDINYQAIYHDRVVAYADYLPPGVYTMHYLVRSVTPGTYEWPGTQAFLEYAPEEFGRAASATAVISD